MWTAEWRIIFKEDNRSYIRNLCSYEKKAWEKKEKKKEKKLLSLKSLESSYV